MAQGFVSGKIGPKWGHYPEYDGFELSVVDPDNPVEVFNYRHQIVTEQMRDPKIARSFVMDMGFRSIYEQYKWSHRD